MIGEDYPAEAYHQLVEDNREMQADLKTAMDIAEAISKRHAKLVEAAMDCIELLEDWFPLIDDMRCASEVDSKKIDRLQAAVKALTKSEAGNE